MKMLIGKMLVLLKRHPLRVAIFVVVQTFTVVAAASSVVYFGLVEGGKTSQILSTDFKALEKVQAPLVEKLQALHDGLLDPTAAIDFEGEMDQLASSAQKTLISLGAVRVPTDKLDLARYEYRRSLEGLVGLANLARRDPAAVTALQYHNAVQLASNSAGEFRRSVELFQGGAFPQIIGSIF